MAPARSGDRFSLDEWCRREKHFRRACTALIKQGEIIRSDAIGIEDDTVLIFRKPDRRL